MAPLEKLLSRLDRVTDLGNGRHRASCPTSNHTKGDRSRGFYVKELDDGQLLIKCHAGCDWHEILSSIGLEASDLYPDNPKERRSPTQQRWNAREVLEVARHEIYVISVALSRLLRGDEFSSDDFERMQSSLKRLRGTLEVV